jgi:hypothetical protein
MTGPPHLIVIGMVTEQRLADFHAEAERHRLGRVAQQGADHRRVWPELAAVAVVLALALLLVANVAVGAA